jgi:hypothetical protein
MKRIQIRFTIHHMLLSVAIIGWIFFNGVLIERIYLSPSEEHAIRPQGFVGPVRVFSFTALAWIAGSLVGCVGASLGWRSTSSSRWAVLRGAIAGGWAGFLAWYFALILLFIGYGVDGQAPLSALIMSILGAALNALPAALIAASWAWFTRWRRQSGRR